MSTPVAGDNELEMHAKTDQFLRLDAGRGLVQMGASKNLLIFRCQVSNGWSIMVPAGTWHNITDTRVEPMQAYAIYALAHYAPGKIQQTAFDAASKMRDAPAGWSVHPPSGSADQHG